MRELYELTYERLLTSKLNENLFVLNEDDDFRMFNIIGSSGKPGRCHSCYCHSKKTTGSVAKIRLDSDELSITETNHHTNCTPLSEREIAFQEFDRQCRKLIKENGLNHIKAYEKARIFAFHYHYSTTEADESANKRPQIERNPNWLSNYDLTQPFDFRLALKNKLPCCR